MKSIGKIERLVEETLDSASGIKPVKAPPFFNDKVLGKMAKTNIQEEDSLPYFNWLIPHYQVAILIALVVINAVALLSNTANSEEYVENIEDFADVYGLSETDMETDSYFYQN